MPANIQCIPKIPMAIIEKNISSETGRQQGIDPHYKRVQGWTSLLPSRADHPHTLRVSIVFDEPGA